MPGRHRDERARVLGPQYVASRKHTPWRIVVIHTPSAERRSDRESSAHYSTEAEAIEAKREIEARICNVTIEMAIDGYERHLVDKNTIGHEETVRRLRLFFAKEMEMMIGRMTPERGKKLYDAFRARTLADGETPISVAYHRAVLINARSMFTFCIDETKWITSNPLANVKGIGKRNSGKRKPTGNELIQWYAYTWGRVESGNDAALALMLELALALRSGDICRRLVREVDLDATQLIIEDGKTDESNEPRFIPEKLQPHVRALVANRGAMEPLFKTNRTETGHHDAHWLWQAQERFCRLAKVPHFCPHSLKGVSGTILAKRGGAGNIVMDHLSHADERTTRRHYVDGGVIEAAQAGEAFKLIAGGKR